MCRMQVSSATYATAADIIDESTDNDE